MSTSRIEADEIRYTLDGSEPTEKSPLYKGSFAITESGVLRAISFKGGRQVSLESKSHHARIILLPPVPDLHISDLTPIRVAAPEYVDGHTSKGVAPSIQVDKSFAGAPLRMRGKTYKKGVGVHAPSQLFYKLKPECERFVAVVGIDDQILKHDYGMHVPHYPSVVFCIYIDGKLLAESPTIRTWRFNVEIPEGSRVVSLVAMDAGNGRFHDVADWVNTGFVSKKTAN